MPQVVDLGKKNKEGGGETKGEKKKQTVSRGKRQRIKKRLDYLQGKTTTSDGGEKKKEGGEKFVDKKRKREEKES